MVFLAPTMLSAQESDFWSESSNENAQSTPNAEQSDDFWSDTSTSTGSEDGNGGFWDTSSSAEVRDRRNQVLAARAEERRRRLAEQRRREEAEARRREREREETRRRWAREEAEDRRREAERRRASSRTYNRALGFANRMRDGGSTSRQSSGLSSSERALMERQRTRPETTTRSNPASKPFLTSCFVNGQTISVTPTRCAQLQKREDMAKRKGPDNCAWKPGDAVVLEACRAD